ncbi:MAG: hypothetical protein NT166_24835 [Candidatus Aminicenantes bacterium]|nr:hypothetical protein [Candidatus Aminicenantes bacterium]
MMIIANPIYDIVFKYLMADLDVAKGVIATIIDEEILMLDFKSQEHVHKFKKADLKKIKVGEEDESDVDIKELIYYHLDFIAKIKMKTGGCKNVLIELQKSNLPPDIMRFRRYLGEQYKKEDEVVDEEELVEEGKERTVIREGLPIITIYFLGYKLSETLPGVIKVNREYIDVLGGGKKIEERSDFIECLTHNSYVIQVPSLHVELKTELERVLSVFQQENFIDETSRLKKYGYKVSDALLEMMLRLLQKAAGDAELMKQLEEEENALHEFEYTYRALAREVKRKKKELEKKEKELDMSKSELGMSKSELDMSKKELEKKDKELDQRKKELDEKERYIQELEEKLKKKGI